MTPTIFRALVRKDLQLNLTVLGLALFFWVGPFLLMAWLTRREPAFAGVPSYGEQVVLGGVILGLGLTSLTALLLGAAAFAAERSDRSAEFLALMPATRGQVVGSKLLVAALPLAIVWVSDLLLLRITRGSLQLREVLPIVGLVAGCFGLSWLGSTLTDRPINALGVALGTFLLLVLALAAAFRVAYGADGFQADDVFRATFWLYALLGLAGLAAGTVIALRRLEP